MDLKKLEEFRHTLHQEAELSNKEENTAQIIKEFITQYNPDEIYEELGGHGIAFLFKGKADGKTIGFRSDMDALPIDEFLELPYASKTKHVAHKCGHDGHATMVAGLAEWLHDNPLEKGNVLLLFQPAEETGEGAERVIESLKEKDIKLDQLFGLHNLPGFEEGQIVCKTNTFAAASKGMIITLKGATSHAAEPENGISPVYAVADIISKLSSIANDHDFEKLTLATVIHTQMGEIAFGTSPGYAEIRATLRAYREKDMKKLTDLAISLVKESANKHQLEHTIDWTEVFPSTVNSEDSFNAIKYAAEANDFNFKNVSNPFKWSEDFGQFKKYTETGFFGLGSGKKHPDLHRPEYDFPDAIIPVGIKMYISLVKQFFANA